MCFSLVHTRFARVCVLVFAHLLRSCVCSYIFITKLGLIAVVVWLDHIHCFHQPKIAAIKHGLMAEHKVAWSSDFPILTVNSTNTTGDLLVSEEIAWQWGFWPFTHVDDTN